MQHHRAWLAIELLESRITPSRFTVLAAIVPSGPAEYSDHTTPDATSRFASTAAAAVLRKHHVAHEASHASAQRVLAKRGPTVFPVRVTPLAGNTPAAKSAATKSTATVSAKTANTRKIAGYPVSASRPAEDGQAGFLPRTTALANDAAIHGVAFGTADTLTLTAAAGSLKNTIAVNMVEPARPALVVSDPSSATAGMSLNGTLTAKDAYGNTVTGFDGNVTLTSTDGQPVHAVAQTAFTNGTADFHVHLNPPERVKLEAASEPIVGTGRAVLLSPAGKLPPFVVSAPGITKAGDGLIVIVTAKNDYDPGAPVTLGSTAAKPRTLLSIPNPQSAASR